MRFHPHTRIARTAALGVTVCAAAALFAGTALSAGASDKIKAKMAGGHWTGGGGGMSWQAGPDKPYTVNPSVSQTAKAKMTNGHWAGGGEQHWQSGPDKKYKTNAQLTNAAKAKRANGYWAGGGEMFWVPGAK